MSKTITSPALPSAMAEKLRSIRRRQVLLAVVRAVAIGASVLIAAMVVAMAVDWALTLFHTGVRTALTLATLMLAAVALLATGVPALVESFRWTRAATSADGEVPQLEERWTTVASIARSNHQPSTPTARAMLQQVTSEAVAMGRLVQPGRVAKPAAVRPAGLLLAGCGLLLAGFLALNWPMTSVLLQRFWSPTADITATRLNSTTGDVEVPRGESLALVTELSGLPRDRAILELETGTEIVDVFELKPDEDRPGAFVYQLTVDESFRYRVRAGDGQTPWHSVTAIDYPALAEVRLTVTTPEYVDRPKYEKTLIPRRIKVLQGSRLELRMKPVASLERLELELTFAGDEKETDKERPRRLLALRPDAEGWYRFETQLLQDMSLSPTLVNVHGLTNEDRRVCRIQVIEDKAPVARIVSPTDEMAVAVDDVIEIEFEAHDDHGIATAELVVYDESGSKDGEEAQPIRVQPIPLGDQRLEKHVMSNAQLDLKELDLREGAQISYAIRVTDNRQVNVDRQALQAQMAEAKPGERDDESSVAGGKDRGKGEPKDKERDGRPGNTDDDLKNMLADASDPSGKRRGPAGEANESESESESEGDGESEGERRSPPGDAERIPGQSTSEEPPADNEKPADGKSNPPGTGKDTDDSTDNAEEPKKDGRNAEGRSQTAKADDPSTADPKNGQTGEQGDDNSEVDKGATGDSRDDVDTKDGEPAIALKADELGDKQPPNKDATPAGEGERSPDETKDKTKTADATKDATRDSERAPDDTARDDESQSGSRSVTVAANDSKSGNGNNNENQSPQDAGSASNPDNQSKHENAGNEPSEQSSSNQTFALNPSQAETGQNTETSRRKLKITERLTAVAAAASRKVEKMKVRDRVVRLDQMLAQVEAGLTLLVDRKLPDADRSEQFRRLDTQLGDVETEIAELRKETQDEQFAFVGLQMVDIGRTHVTPARDRVFVGIREPLGSDNAGVALQHVVRARELLDALLKRYDRVARDQELAKAIDETVKMYEVYVEKMQRLMREARQNRNPLERKMEVVEVDQAYLDRYAEVLTLRREMLGEFARLLGDDPRLLSRYLDLLKRRRDSLRDQLSELAERQEEIATELAGWLQVGEQQRGDLWTIVAELRLYSTGELAKDAAELAEHIVKQMPLALETDQGTAALVIRHAQEIARLARQTTFDAKRIIQQAGQPNETATLVANAAELAYLFGELDAALDQLNFENEGDEEVPGYVTARLLESRTVADRADEWLQIARHLQHRRYHGLAEVDQQKLAIATELLRVEMLAIEDGLRGEFQQQAEGDIPSDILALIRELHRVMEAITFNQPAATFAMTRDRLEAAQIQQAKAVEGFARAEELFDQIRRAVIAVLDEYDPPDPNIADLRDPTLDQFLAQLEREPNIEAQLGLPRRPRNLRVIADTMVWQQQGGDMLADAEEAAMRRAQQTMKMQKPVPAQREKPEKPKAEMTDEEREQLAKAQEMQETLEKSLLAIREKADDPQTSPEQRRKLEKMAKNIQRMLDQMGQRTLAAEDWERIAEADQAGEVLQALARGEAIPDEQWNKLLSTLDDGLWQVHGRTPSEEYRKAIEQYQERLRLLMNTIDSGAE